MSRRVKAIRVYPEQQDEVYHATEVQRLVEKKKEKNKKIADEIVKKARKK